jgi:hypothetical protein
MTLNARAWLALAIATGVLPGYAEYQQRVRHRLVPMVW